MAVQNLIEKIKSEQAAVAARLPAELLSAARRRAALDILVSNGLPSARDENWRYANLRSLDRAVFAAAEGIEFDAALLPPALPGYQRYVLVNGRFAGGVSAQLGEISGLHVARNTGDARHSDSPDERFALLSDVFAIDSLAFDASASSSHRVEIVCVTTTLAAQGTAYPRIAIHARKGSQLSIVERHVSTAGAATLTNVAVTINIDEAATVNHVRWQANGLGGTWIDTLAARVGDNGQYRLRYLSTGASASRSSLGIVLAGIAARCDFSAASVGDGTQVLDVFAEVDHAAPGATTRQLFRGIAGGRSKVAFNGKMIVRQAASGARSDQSLKSLLAGPEAEIAARPQLEVYTDDVSASHGATAGKLDDNMLFYLLSRGLERDVAQLLLKWAFLEDVISQIEPSELRREIEAKLAGRFADIAALDGLLGLNA